MTNAKEDIAVSQTEAMHDYMVSKYANYNSYYTDMISKYVTSETAYDSSTKSLITSALSTSQPAKAIFDATGATQFLEVTGHAATAGGIVYLNQLSETYKAANTWIGTRSIQNPSSTLFQSTIDMVELNKPANVNIDPKIAGISKFAAKASMAVEVGASIPEIITALQNGQSPEAVGIKYGMTIGSGIVAADITAGVIVAALGGPTVVVGSAAVLVAVGASIAAAGVTYVVKENWDTIVSTVQAGINLAKTTTQIIADVTAAMETAIDSFFNLAGSTAATALSEASHFYNELMGGIFQSVDALEDWIESIKDAFLSAIGAASPLVLDLDGTSGIQLASVTSSGAVYWDIDQDGFREASGWVSGGDGFLAIDLDDDGVINNNGELFGNSSAYANGFLALAFYDSNHDNQITSGDTKFNDLLVWIDANHDGYSQEDELQTLTDLGITSINLAYTDTNTNNNGNTIKQTSTFVQSGNTKTIVDAWFAYDNVNTVYNEDYTLDARTLFLPTLRGYGELPDMHIAASIDNTGTGNLLGKIETLAGKTFAQIFDNTTTLSTDIKAIMWRWAGVDGVSSTARGPYADARDLGFLEKLMGQDFLQKGVHDDPYGPDAGYFVAQAATEAFNNIYARLVAQSAGGELLEGDWSYNPVTDSFEGITGLVQSKLDDLETEAIGLANTAARQVFWSNVLRMVEFTVGVNNLTTPEKTALNTAIEDSDSALDMNTMVAALDYSAPTSVTINGTSGADTMNGSSGNDVFNGQAGNDTISGGAGNDTLNGNAGDDSLTGGTGGDYLLGGANNDTYYYNVGDGFDTIYDLGTNTGQTDTIVFGAGITAGDLTFTRLGDTDLLIEIGGATPGQILIEQQFYSNAYRRIETINLSGGSTIDLTTKVFTTHGTSGVDYIYGIKTAVASTTDTIYGYGGDDTLYGDDGDDTIYGGDGNDIITGDNGADTLYGEAGGDTIKGYAGNDAIYGGTGDDLLIGGGGNDTYYYNVGDGNDTIAETASLPAEVAEIVFGAGITSGNLTMTRQGNYDLLIEIGGVTPGQILVKDHFRMSGGVAYDRIETLRFSGGSTIDTSTVTYVTHGTAGNDSIAGIYYSGQTNDTIYGYGGNDTIGGDDGTDIIYGGDGNDSITGGAGADTLYGEAGNDTLYGGAGNDIYYYSTGNDIIGEGSSSPGGTDEIRLRDGIVAEDLVFTRSGNSAVINVIGGESFTMDNVFNGSNYIIETIRFFDNTTLDPTLKTYTTYGTSGNNTIYGITSGGSINEIIYGLEGADDISAGTGNDIIYGGDGNDTLYGGTGDDIFDGGAGNDTMDDGGGVTGSGNDTYYYSAGMDRIYDGGGGTDTLRLTTTTIEGITMNTTGYDLNVVLSSGVDEIKILWWTWSATYKIETIAFADGFSTTFDDYASWVYGTTGVDSLSGTANHDTIIGKAGNDTISGNGGADNIHGGDGNDTLNGNDGDDVIVGGTGNDTMTGGLGNDTFGVDSASDVVTESSGEGTDTILTSVSYSVSANVENMTLIGTGNINATGSSIANVLTGNSGNNNIDGLGGADTMLGGLGDDTYVVDNTSDVVTEYQGEGTDVIQSSVTYTLSANVENLTLTNSSNINGTGNGLRNTIIGNSGTNTLYGGDNNDTLSGEGGNDALYGQNGIDLLWADAGVDNLYGGAGADTFKFATTSLGGSDFIKDFSAAEGDIINVHDLLVGYDPLTKLLTDFVEITTSGANSILKVDRDGTGGTYSWTQIAQIDGVTGMTDEAAQVSSGRLVL